MLVPNVPHLPDLRPKHHQISLISVSNPTKKNCHFNQVHSTLPAIALAIFQNCNIYLTSRRSPQNSVSININSTYLHTHTSGGQHVICNAFIHRVRNYVANITSFPIIIQCCLTSTPILNVLVAST